MFLTFFQLLAGCALPTLLLSTWQIPIMRNAGAWPEGGYNERPAAEAQQPHTPGAPAGSSAPGACASSSGGSSSSGDGSSGGGSSASNSAGVAIAHWAACAAGCLRWLAEEAEARVEELSYLLCGGSGFRLLTTASWTVLLSLLWMLAMLLEGQA